jgi:membrane-associated protease RseP (regulator of RpoE activity)
MQTEEVIRQNKFVGWRLVAFPAEWDASGLQPGDVITDVNGTVLEKPDDLWTTWLAVADASEVRIAYERDGKPSATVLTILGTANPETRKNLEAGAMLAPEPAAEAPRGKPRDKKRFETKVIGGEASEPSDVSEF